MLEYQIPPRAIETVHCYDPNSSVDCKVGRNYDQRTATFLAGDFEVRHNEETGEMGVFSKVEIPKMSYIQDGEEIFFEPKTREMFSKSAHYYMLHETLPLAEYSAMSTIKSNAMQKVPASFSTGFPALIKRSSSLTKINVGTLSSYLMRENLCSPNAAKGECHEAHNPVVDRHLSTYGSGLVTLRDILPGEELFIL
eukprot:CAMPEP_0195510186 /NCGR_PEP_ID=MMETSP0794_2-20130614/2908_1 /TAXON_ID=515487 /ORGANISM="Stephanopyxis turris, Strain CCMP 815" /LENGTH=195 /DNA_ID=CAMNT_0040637561 /DNA_START=143 /DNA_END=730 /DNA_ORIENTATION=-